MGVMAVLFLVLGVLNPGLRWLGWNQDYVGMTEQAAKRLAKSRKHIVRVVERDGQGFPMTMDYRENRVNFVIEDGVVVSYRMG